MKEFIKEVAKDVFCALPGTVLGSFGGLKAALTVIPQYVEKTWQEGSIIYDSRIPNPNFGLEAVAITTVTTFVGTVLSYTGLHMIEKRLIGSNSSQDDDKNVT